MNTTRRIARNTAILTIAEVVTAVINLFFTMYVARYLGAEGFGLLSFALAFTAIFGVFTDIGLNQLTTREVARDKTLALKYLGNITSLKVILNVATFGLIALTVNLLGYPAQTKNVVYLSSLFLVANAFCVMFYSIFQAYEKMEFVTFGRVLNAVLLMAGALFAVVQHLSVISFALIYFLSSAVTLLCNVGFSIWKFAKPHFDVDLSFWGKTLKQAWPFGLSGVFSGIYFWIGSVMLASKGNDVVGWYNVAYRLVFALSVVPSVYFTAAFPVMSRFYITSRESLKIINEKSIKYMLMLAVPIAIGTTLLADKIILLVFDKGYSNSVFALQILVWAVAFVFLSSGFARLFESLNKQLMVTVVAASCSILNVALNLVLIPMYSYKGAGIATLATEFTAMAFLFFWSYRIGYGISAKRVLDIVARTFVAGAAMGLFVFYLRNLTLWVLIPAAALLYFAVLLIIKGMDKEDRQLLQQMIGRKPSGVPAINANIKSKESNFE